MCLYLLNKEAKIEIAKEFIIVYKYILPDKNKPNMWIAPIMETTHEFDKELQACEHLTVDAIKSTSCQRISIGFHAFTKCSYHIPTIAIIPKGAEYCIGEYNEIVSNKIIVFSNEDKLKEYVSVHS